MRTCSILALALLFASMLACSSSSAPPLVASGGSGDVAGSSSPELPPCNTSVDAGDQNGAFLDATVDSGPSGTSNPITPSDGGTLIGVDGAANPTSPTNPCPT